jgi:catechol 2,3-dioxygenase
VTNEPNRLASLLMSAQRPDFDIIRSAHAELLVSDLEASERFYVGVLGMVVTERTAEAIYLRGWEEQLHHCLILRSASAPAVAHLAFRVRAPHHLELLASELEGQGLTVSWSETELGQGPALRVLDPVGFPLEFFHDMQPAESGLRHFDVQRGAPIMRLDHFNLHVPDVERYARFLLGLGFRCSEYISTDGSPEQLTGAWLLRKPSVHDVALTAGRGPRLHHIGMWVSDTLGVLRACDQLAAAGWASHIERGPGRHGVSNAFFVYLRDPDGHRIELYTCDYYTGDPDLRPLRWSVNDESCRSFWGTRAPDSWYEESSTVVDFEGAPVATESSPVDERTEMMA